MVKKNVEPKKKDGPKVPGWTPELGSRLSSAITDIGGLVATGEIVGVTDEQVGRWRDGLAKLPFAAIIKIATHAGKSLDWFAGLTGNAEKPPVSATQPPETMVAIPVFEIVASAGPGMVAFDDKPVDHLWFNETWLRQTYGVNPSDLKLMPSTGDSMEPTIASGAMLLVNTNKAARMPGDGIFVVRLEGDILVKRLQRVPGGQIKVSSDNAAYDPFHIKLDDGAIDFALLGRVVIAVDLKRL